MIHGATLALLFLLQHGPASEERPPAAKPPLQAAGKQEPAAEKTPAQESQGKQQPEKPPAEKTESREQPPAAKPGAGEPQAAGQAPAKPGANEATGAGAKQEDVKLEQILEDPEMHAAASKALEAEVSALRETLGGLVSEGEMGVELLEEVEGSEQLLKDLGVTDERAETIRLMTSQVQALRARLRLIELRAPEDTKVLEKDQNEGFDPLEDQATQEVEELAARLAEQRGARVGNVRKQRSLYPNREALLAFKQGDYAGVIEVLKPFEPREIQVDALYAYGCALVEVRDFETARGVLERVKSFSNRRTLCDGAEKQLKRMNHLEHGIVGPEPDMRELNER